jgi:chemotaxis methyl-accepting protein methylase
MSIGTLFLRNRPMLECMCHLLQHRQRNSSVKITVLGCSKGAEVYSMLICDFVRRDRNWTSRFMLSIFERSH